jgi:hypothetical protein
MPPSEHDKAGIVEKFEKSIYSPYAGRNFPTQVYFGDTHLHTAAWADPDFDPTEKAFYYVRVLEIPTPRWTTYDAKVCDVEIPEGAPTSIQERAYTSPIWYTP